MSAKNRPYEQFGSFILFKKLETDALGDLWRAGRVDNGQLGPTMAVRRLLGGNRGALTAAAGEAHNLVPLLAGTTFAKDQTIDVANGIPFVAHEYAGGRSLRHIVDRARGGNGVTANPVPLDQAIVIPGKSAPPLATTPELRYPGNLLAPAAPPRPPRHPREAAAARSASALRDHQRYDAGAPRARARRQLLRVDVQPRLLPQ